MRPRREAAAKAETVVVKKLLAPKTNKAKDSKATIVNKKTKKETPLSNGAKEDHDEGKKIEVPAVPEQKMNGNGEPKQKTAGQEGRKRQAPKVAEEGPKQAKIAKVGKKGKTSSAKVDIPSTAADKKQTVSFDLPTLPIASGVIFVIGDNTVGQLGLSENIHGKKRPFRLDLPVQFVEVAAGGMHSVCLTEKGKVYTFGCNDEGALGRVTEDEEGSEYIPKITDVPGIVVKVTAGDSHSAALTKEGHVYIWGNFKCNEGFMGLTSHGVKQTSPIRILNVEIVDISSGSDHLACLSRTGVVYTCGCGEVGQLGRVTERSSKGEGRKGYDCLLVPDSVHVGTRRMNILVDAIWAGSYSTYIRTKDTGLIYAFGLNNYNQLGFENELSTYRPRKVESFNAGLKWKHISGGQHHTLALDEQGQVYSLGRKEYGRLGLGEDTTEKSQPTTIPTLNSENCINISSGNVVSFSVTERGTVHSWGMGTNYQLGHGNDDDCHIPKLIEGELLNSWHVLKVSGGGQHTLILAKRKVTSEDKADSEMTSD